MRAWFQASPGNHPLYVPLVFGGGSIAAVLMAVAVVRWGGYEGAVAGAALAALVACAIIDVVSYRIPNAITYSGLAVVLMTAAVVGAGALVDSLLGVLIGGGLAGILSLVSRGGFGLGDAKLSAFGGALLGYKLVLYGLFLGSVGAGMFCLPLLLMGRIQRRTAIAYGPFLSAGFAAVAMLGGTVLTS